MGSGTNRSRFPGLQNREDANSDVAGIACASRSAGSCARPPALERHVTLTQPQKQSTALVRMIGHALIIANNVMVCLLLARCNSLGSLFRLHSPRQPWEDWVGLFNASALGLLMQDCMPDASLR